MTLKRLVITAEFDDSNLGWQGVMPGDDISAAYNKYYEESPWEAFEIAMQDDNFKVIAATIIDVPDV